MVPGFICFCGFNIVNGIAVLGTGLGFHVYDLSEKDIRNFIIVKYMHVVLWFCVLHFCRCCILHLLLRLTPLQLPAHRRFLITLIWASYLYLFICISSHLFECGIPLSNSFDPKASYDGTCVGSVSLSFYGGLISGHIALDFLTIIPPLFVLSKIPMSATKKSNLVILLIFGAFTMFCSLIRVFYFYKIMISSYDITWTATAVSFWSTLECCLACVIASLPALNHIIVKHIRRKFKCSDTPRDPTNRLGIIQFMHRRPLPRGRQVPNSSLFGDYTRFLTSSTRASKGSSNPKTSSSSELQSKLVHEKNEIGTNSFTGAAEREYYVIEERVVCVEVEEDEEELRVRRKVDEELALPPQAHLQK
ncbi:hypothetical protein AA313_de0205478 [Arthrobotrys entomopaga]|nr:hypothetical protein AA313_de0205478 [Arthrobotrys entomopaga]